MVYRFDDYKNAYPNRPFAVLNKFQSCSKNLHEMSLDELNDFIKDWKPTNNDRTVDSWKRDIVNYFKWLQEQGCKTNTSIIRKINFPTLEKKYLIYSSSDIRHYYDLLFQKLEQQAALTGKSTSKTTYYMSYASSLLMFYGLSEEEIIALDLSDVQIDGIIGYENLNISKEDMKVLLDYKNLKVLSNNMSLVGTKYIRATAKNKGKIDAAYLSKPVTRLDSSFKEIKTLLRPLNIQLLGKFNLVYQYEREHNEFIEISKTTPQWFMDLMGSSAEQTVIWHKKEYVKYRQERVSNEKPEPEGEHNNPEGEHNNEVQLNKLTEALNDTLTQINGLTNKITDIQNQIELIKNKK